jgi:hypothetical protein
MQKREKEAMMKDKFIQKGRDLRTAKTILLIRIRDSCGGVGDSYWEQGEC